MSGIRALLPWARNVVTVVSFMSLFSSKVLSRNLLPRNMTSTGNHAFKEDFRFAVNDYINVTKYVSSQTGLVVTIADVPGPVVDGYLVLATEAHDDDGLPHTLEHLVFMGSEAYPFKGRQFLETRFFLARAVTSSFSPRL